jgi:hypothetical protein
MKVIGIKQVNGTLTVVNFELVTHIEHIENLTLTRINFVGGIDNYIETAEQPASIMQRLGMGLVLK